MKKYILAIAVIAIITISCNDDFMEKHPKTSLTEDTAFKTYDNFKAYMFHCYEMFTNGNIATSLNNGFAQNGPYRGDVWSGLLARRNSYNPYAFQTISNASSGNGWNFGYIRHINLMLENVDKASDLSQAERDHWKSVGYFFHSYWYMELVNRFGDIPWVTSVLNESSPEAYGPRDSRIEVTDLILERLKWAEANIGNFQNRDGSNTISKEVIQATLSRFTLREATWRKYHELGDYNKYLNECIRVSEELMNNHPSLYYGVDGQPAAGYGEMWITEDLKNTPGVIFYKSYVEAVLTHDNGQIEHTSSHIIEMPQHTIDLYLCKDGKPIGTSSIYDGDKDMYSTFRNRDPRLYHTVMPPYKVNAGSGDYATWSFTDNIDDREYLDILGLNESCSNPGIGMKRLPAQNWTADLLPYTPNLQNGLPEAGTKAKAFVASRSGYYVWKHWSQWETNFNNGALNTSDKPIFKIEEVILNYAESKWELGQFNQAAADISINKLRDRAGMSKMNISEIDNSFDPNRDQSIDPILWEIRRERIIELMGEGFSFDDIRRWKVAPWFVNKQQLGMWISQSKVNESLWDKDSHLATRDLDEGYIFLWGDPIVEGKGWLDKYYLYQVPTDEIILNPALKQNPGY